MEQTAKHTERERGEEMSTAKQPQIHNKETPVKFRIVVYHNVILKCLRGLKPQRRDGA